MQEVDNFKKIESIDQIFGSCGQCGFIITSATDSHSVTEGAKRCASQPRARRAAVMAAAAAKPAIFFVCWKPGTSRLGSHTVTVITDVDPTYGSNPHRRGGDRFKQNRNNPPAEEAGTHCWNSFWNSLRLHINRCVRAPDVCVIPASYLFSRAGPPCHPCTGYTPGGPFLGNFGTEKRKRGQVCRRHSCSPRRCSAAEVRGADVQNSGDSRRLRCEYAALFPRCIFVTLCEGTGVDSATTLAMSLRARAKLFHNWPLPFNVCWCSLQTCR
jgi:hypothetical protein